MYPIKFKSIYVRKPWEGTKLSSFKKTYQEKDDHCGISWEVSGHATGDLEIANGEFAGKTLSELVTEQGRAILGDLANVHEFPLRLAYLDAAEDLSIQVHPQEAYAKLHESDGGKSESWYIIEADEGATLVAGTTLTDKKEIVRAAEEGTIEEHLIRVPVKAGDIVNIKAGLIHALGAGILAIEVGENSNITYRLYDYNRGRQLDIEKSYDVICPEYRVKRSPYFTVHADGYDRSYCYFEEEYAIEVIDVRTEYEVKEPERFFLFTSMEGDFTIQYAEGEESLVQGESVMIPANLKVCKFVGEGRLLKSYVPNIEKTKDELAAHLQFTKR